MTMHRLVVGLAALIACNGSTSGPDGKTDTDLDSDDPAEEDSEAPATHPCGGGCTWTVETIVAAGGLVGEVSRAPQFAAAVDRDRNLHVLIADPVAKKIHYGQHDGATWQVETVDTAGESATIGYYGTALAIDDDGNAHAAWSTARYRYGTNAGGSWAIEEFGPADTVLGAFTGVAYVDLDSGGSPHVIVGRGYVVPEGDAWLNLRRPPVMPLGFGMDGDIAHAIWRSEGTLVHGVLASDDADSWTKEVATEFGPRATGFSLDRDGAPHIGLEVRPEGEDQSDARYAHHDGTAWVLEDIETSTDVGASMSTVVDAGARVHATFIGGLTPTLMYAWRDLDGWWDVDPIDTGGDPTATQVLLGPGGLPIVLFVDREAMTVNVAWAAP